MQKIIVVYKMIAKDFLSEIVEEKIELTKIYKVLIRNNAVSAFIFCQNYFYFYNFLMKIL